MQDANPVFELNNKNDISEVIFKGDLTLKGADDLRIGLHDLLDIAGNSIKFNFRTVFSIQSPALIILHAFIKNYQDKVPKGQIQIIGSVSLSRPGNTTSFYDFN